MDPVKLWLAERLKIHPEQVQSYSFSASPAHVYSEWTEEGMSCRIEVRLRDIDKIQWVFLYDNDVIDFLNDFWKLSTMPLGNK